MDNQLDPLVWGERRIGAGDSDSLPPHQEHPVLIGEPGRRQDPLSSKAAQRIAERRSPSFLADKRILGLDLSLIVAGTKYRGQF